MNKNIENARDFVGNFIKVGDTVVVPMINPVGEEGFLVKGTIEDLYISSYNGSTIAVILVNDKEPHTFDASEIMKIV